MGKLLLTLQYDGTRYHGWQVQPNGITVQETLQNALERVTGTRPGVTGCSRTDAGVHALHFYCTTECPERWGAASLCKALNAVLPEDVVVLSCREVPAEFHPRYSAIGKRYRYQLWNGAVRSPFWKGHSLYVRAPLDVDRLNETASLFLGKHDFSAFCSSGSSVEDKCRTITRSTVQRSGDLVTYTVEADGFLYNMVRILVGTLLDVHAGRLSAEDLQRALATGDRAYAGVTAPAHGLFLDDVFYRAEVST